MMRAYFWMLGAVYFSLTFAFMAGFLMLEANFEDELAKTLLRKHLRREARFLRAQALLEKAT